MKIRSAKEIQSGAYPAAPKTAKYTRKPCPGCKQDGDGHIWRKEDEVCNYCRKLINEALEAREKVSGAPGSVLMCIPGRDFDWPGFHGGLSRSNCCSAPDSRRHMAELLQKLATSVGRLSPSEYAGMSASGLPSYSWSSGNYLGSTAAIRIDPEVAKLIDGLDSAIRKALQETYEGGVRDGSDLLNGLASGRLTVDGFNRESLREPREKHAD